ncbi:MAG: ferrous iron transport protein A [Epsilonproteobacteria bacterium]|nr:ferrous iron transport protein A [Campylobacterota bacterium]
MKLTQLKVGESGVIEKVVAPEPIKSRLFSMGITKGNRIKVIEHTLKKETWGVEVEGSKIALREEEAGAIEVKND